MNGRTKGDEGPNHRDPMFGFVIGRRHYALAGTLSTFLKIGAAIMLAGTAFAYGRSLLGFRTVSTHVEAIDSVATIATEALTLSKRNASEIQKLSSIVELQTVLACLKLDATSPGWLVRRCDRTLAASQAQGAPVVPSDVTDTSGRTQ